MTKNQEISLSSGLLISVFVSGLVYFFLFIATFDLFGLEEIRDPESRHAKFFYTGLAITVLTAFAIIILFRNNRKYAAMGTGLPVIIALFLMVRFGVIYFNKSNYYENFDKEKWMNSKEKPIKMARGLVKDEVLIGLTKDQVIKMLGKGTANNWQGEENIQYGTEYWYCVLGLTLEDGKVKTAGLWVDD